MNLAKFVSELGMAAGRITLQLGDRTVTPQLSIGESAHQPMMVVVWQTQGPDDCRLTISPNLLNSSRISYAAHRLSGLWPLMEAFYRYSLYAGVAPTGRVNINVDDHQVLPGLAFCANDPSSFLIPDAVFIGERGYKDTRLSFATAGLPWRNRKPCAIWRGATTGHSNAGWRGLPRIKLCQLSGKHPELLDARITSVVQLERGAETDIEKAGLLSAEIPVHQFGEWRVQIDIDGNTNSWPGLFQKLLTGSPVVKVASPGRWRQWYYDRLKAWENFVPAEANLSDLVEKLAWLRDHEAQAYAIGMAGRDLALSITYEAAVLDAVPTILSAMKAG